MDKMGREYSNDTEYFDNNEEDFNLKYLNLINIPTMFDVGC